MKGRPPLLLLFFMALEGIAAQQPQVAPLPVFDPVFAKHKNKLYIYGGYTNIDYTVDPIPSGQFFALDLSKPWTSKSPSWIQLPTGPRWSGGWGGISLDGIKFVSFPDQDRNPSVFSFETKIWSPSKAAHSRTVSASVTLGDGTILMAGGFISSVPGSQNSSFGVYDIYSFDSDNVSNTLFPPPSADFNSTQFMMRNVGFGAVWSQYLKSAVHYGGVSPIYMGDIPTIRSDLVFTYHPESRVWQQKSVFHTPLPIGIGDGITARPVDFGKPSTPVNIYQISTGTWVSEYNPSAEYLDPVPVPPSKTVSPPSPSSESSHPSMDQSSDAKLDIGIIAGGTVGGVAVVALIGFLVWMRKKRGSRRRQHHDDPPSDTSFTSYRKESMVDRHATSRVIQTPSRVPALHPSRYPYDSDVVDDDATDNRHSANDVNFHATRRATRSPPPNPYSHSSGANVYNSYAADGSRYSDRTLASPHSGVSGATTYGYELPHYSPSPPSRSRSGSRNPQMLDHSHMMHTRPYATGGRWVDERPGPQWQP
ncbi:hypothetical protein DFQ27_007196 [Actinomortierella ambigua]|uniref:Galactose oxidase n=1 Tax=Actinomortierella ambigua TaxID=1343610 RepID=A0A9P6PUA5_9FUNG|nr:hypothetical protein DFQ27_007196 [Actinomortierella ambigua]